MDTQAASPASFNTRLLRTLAAAIPGADTDAHEEAAQELLASLNPRDPAEAQLAAIAIAAAQAAMDNFARAARPGVSDETALRLRGSALAAGRAYASALRYLRKPPAPAPQPSPQPRRARSKAPPAAAPDPPPAEPAGGTTEVPPGFVALQAGATPIPAVFSPRDRLGNEIPRLAPRPHDPGPGPRRRLLPARSRAGRRGNRRRESDDGRTGAARHARHRPERLI